MKQLDFILNKKMSEYSTRGDINYKIAVLEANKLQMQNRVSKGGAYIALKLYDHAHLDPPEKQTSKNDTNNITQSDIGLSDVAIKGQITSDSSSISKCLSLNSCLEILAEKVLIHSPHKKNVSTSGRMIWSETNREIATLNINHSITCLATGILNPKDGKDVLVIGINTHILVYNVHDNKDIFYKECQDGAKSLAIGTFNGSELPLVMVGGNSSVHGFDTSGREIFWTAFGEVITSLVLMDFTKSGLNELIVASEDFNIRIFKGNQVLATLVETEMVTNLIPLPEHRLAYSVSNGTVGAYEQEKRLWRIKSKNVANALHPYDLVGQSKVQLVTGWSHGKIDCRSVETGEVYFKESMNSCVAGIVEGDYRSTGRADVICVSCEGEVRGYSTAKHLKDELADETEQNIVKELLAQKQMLLMELKHYEVNNKFNEDVVYETDSFENRGVIPANTRLQMEIKANDMAKKPHVQISLSTNNSTIIKSVVIFAEGIFKGETHIVHPQASKLCPDLSVSLFLPKDTPIDIHVKAMVGYPNTVQFHIFEITRQLPRFSMYSLIPTPESNMPEGYVQFKVNERLERICMWINQNFLLESDIDVQPGHTLTISFKCLRNGLPLVLNFEKSGNFKFYTDSMLLASDLIQSMTSYLNIDTLKSVAVFPDEEKCLKLLIDNLSNMEDANLRLGADFTQKLREIGTLVIQAEDSRLCNETEMISFYHELMKLNEDMINEHNIRLRNYTEGVNTMKQINAFLQKTSRLRVGQKSSDILNHCRNAIKTNNIEELINIIRRGET